MQRVSGSHGKVSDSYPGNTQFEFRVHQRLPCGSLPVFMQFPVQCLRARPYRSLAIKQSNASVSATNSGDKQIVYIARDFIDKQEEIL
jgi:hypothetical protein